MQPYFFPYVGYFQLAHAVDRFVFYDDVAFRKRSWINRNRVLTPSGEERRVTVPCLGASQNRRICDVGVDYAGPAMRKLGATLANNYRKAPNYCMLAPLLNEVLEHPYDSIGDLASSSVLAICRYLDIEPCFSWSSRTGYDNVDLDRADRLADITRRVGGKEYVNLPGGETLYSSADFSEHGVTLRFLRPDLERFAELVGAEAASVSMLHHLMWQPRQELRAALEFCQVD
jgi:hypothetical protein